jgi:hypothetical protein
MRRSTYLSKEAAPSIIPHYNLLSISQNINQYVTSWRISPWEADTCSPNQKIPLLVSDPKIDCMFTRLRYQLPSGTRRIQPTTLHTLCKNWGFYGGDYEDIILHSHRRENLRSYIVFLYGEAIIETYGDSKRCRSRAVLARATRRNIPEDNILYIHLILLRHT